MLVLSSLLSCALMREEKKLTVNCLYLLNLLVGGPNRSMTYLTQFSSIRCSTPIFSTYSARRCSKD